MPVRNRLGTLLGRQTFMRRSRCSFCQRQVGRMWFRCRVCGTRLALWYIFALTLTLAALSILALILFREVEGRLPF